MLRIDPEVFSQGQKTKNLLAKLARSPHPRLYASLVVLNPRLDIEVEMEPPEQAKVDVVLSKLPQADAIRGEELFFSKTIATNCVTCHRVSGRGNSFAPDLSGVGLRSDARKIVQSILEPSATITEGFQLQTFVMDDGTTFSGAVLDESAAGIRIVKTDGFTEMLDTKSVESRVRSNVSAMPTGFELLGNEQVADIAAYLMTCRHGATTASFTSD